MAIDWSGFYVGVSAGFADGDITATDNTSPQGGFYTPLGDPGTYGFDFNDSGFAAGGHLGAQWQSGSFVYGLEGSWTYTDISNQIVSPYFPDSDTETGEIENYATAVARIGYAFGNTMIYAKGGYAGGKVKFTARDNEALFTYTSDEWQNGYALGAGVDYALSDSLILGIDYTHVDLGDSDSTGPNVGDDGTLGANTNTYNTEANADVVTARISYKFSGM
jgi:outer membrane immunogenic protein